MKFRLPLIAALASSIIMTTPALSNGLAGPYLAARQAAITSNFSEAVDYYRKAIFADPQNPALLENAIIAFIAKGEIEGAVQLAERLVRITDASSVVSLLLNAEAAKRNSFADIKVEDTAGEGGIAPLVIGLVEAWAAFGDGRMSDTTAVFDRLASTDDFQSLAHYHKGLAFALVGDFEAADRILSGEEHGALVLSARGIRAHAQVLVQLDRRQDAIDLLDAATQGRLVPSLADLRARIDAGAPVEFDFLTSAGDGVAEVYFNMASILNGRATAEHILIYSRLAEYLRPTHADAILLSAETLEDIEQYDLASDAYASIPVGHPSHFLAEMGRADTLYKDDRLDAAIEVMRGLAKTDESNPFVHSALGDMLSRSDQDKDAIDAYSVSISLRAEDDRSAWRSYYARGIVYERIKQYPEMESDFRKALDLLPDQPDVLNYLGYSLVEQRIKLDEALGMIQKAVELRPDSGYITDSLAWVYYRLGRFEEALEPMERAAELLPIDPIINDHLGDIYWVNGRKREAEFQWKRALSFEPEEIDATRIRRKLEVGLDVVLEDEGGVGAVQTAND